MSALIAYRPISAVGAKMWTDFPLDQIKLDLQTLRSIGADTIRVSLFPSIAYPVMPSLEQYRLQQFIGACAELDMRVKLVLFGGIKPWLDTLDSIAYLDNFHWYYNLNKVIDSVDLYDELDLDVIGTNAWPMESQ